MIIVTCKRYALYRRQRVLAKSHFLVIQCFGEWFQVLSIKTTAQKGLFGLYSPLLRWLQDIAMKEIDSYERSFTTSVVLKSLYKFCSESSDLVRSFMLAALCREAVANATRRKEERTHGKICSDDAGKSN